MIASICTVAVAAPLGYWGWRTLESRGEAQLNCAVMPPHSLGATDAGRITFRPATRLESGFAISYTEAFAVGPSWTLSWNSARRGLRAVFLYDATITMTDTRPHVANTTGNVGIWWNDITASPTGETVSDAPWAKTFERTVPGKYCLSILETAGSWSDWTVTITDR